MMWILNRRQFRQGLRAGAITTLWLALGSAASSAACNPAHGFLIAEQSVQHSKTIEIAAKESFSTDGGVWLVQFYKDKVVAIVRIDFGESRNSTTTYQKISGGLAIKVLVESNDKTFKPTEDVFLQCGDVTYFGFPINYLKLLKSVETFDPNKTRDDLVGTSNELLRAKEIESYVAAMQVQ
jgi:hypothetical protein